MPLCYIDATDDELSLAFSVYNIYSLIYLTVLTHTPINYANIIALPLLLGLGVANAIHMVETLYHSLSEEQNGY